MKKVLLCFALVVVLFSIPALAQLQVSGGDKAPKVGDMAPDFPIARGTSAVADVNALKDLQGKKNVLLMFFPGAFTPGCTTEFTEAGQKFDQITALNIEMIGISRDMPGAQREFKKSVGAKNGFLSDPDLTVTTMYDAVRPTGTPKAANRYYFLIDQKGKVIWRSVNGSLIPTDQLIADLGKVLASQQ
jgi:peroxiredoxin